MLDASYAIGWKNARLAQLATSSVNVRLSVRSEHGAWPEDKITANDHNFVLSDRHYS